MFSINTINATRWYNAKRKNGANLAETQQTDGYADSRRGFTVRSILACRQEQILFRPLFAGTHFFSR
ncbi:hypothetical protein AGR6A_pTi0201 [Agrobacterium sp. NCPPB 925]|nr:hypothetical protein AGR6A_pTi0201 [Agrobacterium sp. NCPPB 925]